MKYCLAIDIGASSGRHIVGWKERGEIKTKEVYRFPNGVVNENGHLVWRMPELVKNVLDGIDAALAEFGRIESLSVDTWGVDYVLMKGDREVWPVFAYRDSRTEKIIPEVHKKIPFSELYARTGCQFQPFNSLYQLCADREAGRLEGVSDVLMIPEYLLYRICGVKVREYTNATTMGLINAQTGGFDHEICDRLGLPRELFPKLERPGKVIGSYKGIKVMLCATHDTGSAVEGIPMEGDSLYISSGTWSLLGAKTPRPLTDAGSRAANYSNEGGVGYNRYQKNIMGMWLQNELHREIFTDLGWKEIDALVEKSSFDGTVDADNSRFLAPKSMKAEFEAALGYIPQNPEDYFRCAYSSLAICYRDAIRDIERNTGRTYDRLYIVGGGARNRILNRMTEELTGKKIIALPIEATSIGNLKIQLEAQNDKI